MTATPDVLRACVYECVCVQGSLLELACVQCTDIWINLSVIFSVALNFTFFMYKKVQVRP